MNVSSLVVVPDCLLNPSALMKARQEKRGNMFVSDQAPVVSLADTDALLDGLQKQFGMEPESRDVAERLLDDLGSTQVKLLVLIVVQQTPITDWCAEFGFNEVGSKKQLKNAVSLLSKYKNFGPFVRLVAKARQLGY